MQQLNEIRMDSFLELFLRFETTLKRIEKLTFVQKEQSDEIKGRVESIEKYVFTKEQVNEVKHFIARGQAATREQIDEIKRSDIHCKKAESKQRLKWHLLLGGKQHPGSRWL